MGVAATAKNTQNVGKKANHWERGGVSRLGGGKVLVLDRCSECDGRTMEGGWRATAINLHIQSLRCERGNVCA